MLEAIKKNKVKEEEEKEEAKKAVTLKADISVKKLTKLEYKKDMKKSPFVPAYSVTKAELTAAKLAKKDELTRKE